MGADVWTYHSTYLGVDIEVYTETALGRTSYRAFLDDEWWSSTSLGTVQFYIDRYLEPEPDPEPEPEPEPEEGVIAVYLNPPIDGATLELRDRSFSRDTLERVQLSVNGASYFEAQGLPDYYMYVVRFPPQETAFGSYQEAETPVFMFQSAPRSFTLNLLAGPDFIETYRDVDIYWKPTISLYWAQVAVGYIAISETLDDIKMQIDSILAFLYPDEDPDEGLFAQIGVAIQVWVMDLMPGWVLEWGTIVNNYLTETIENITNIYNDLSEYVTNVYNNVYELVENTYNTFQEYVTNSYNYLTEEITNVYNNTYNYFSEVIGASVEWVDDRLVDMTAYIDSRIALLDPNNFLANPPEYISGIFSILGLAKETGMIESFLAGLVEGLDEETEG